MDYFAVNERKAEGEFSKFMKMRRHAKPALTWRRAAAFTHIGSGYGHPRLLLRQYQLAVSEEEMHNGKCSVSDSHHHALYSILMECRF